MSENTSRRASRPPPGFEAVIAAAIGSTFATSCAAAVISIALQTGANRAASNSAALQAAINHAAVGDTIQISPGIFSVSDSLTLKSRTNIAGAGAAITTLLAAFAYEQPLIIGSDIQDVDLHGFTLDGSGNSHVTQGVELESSTSLTIHDLAIVNLPGSDQPNAPLGPHAIDCTRAVTNSVFNAITCRSIGVGRTWGGGIRLSWGSSGNRVTQCTVERTGRGGIFCNDGSTDNIITGNTVLGSGGVGLGIEVQNCDRSLIEHNKIDHWLSLDNSSMSGVRHNTVGTADGTYKLCGIEIVDSHDVVVSGNVVSGGAKVGLSISGPLLKERLVFSNNLLQQSTTWGAQIQGDAGGVREVYFDRNRFLDTRLGPQPLYPNQGHGVRINGNAHWITFDQNDISQNAGAGIQITGGNVDNVFAYQNILTANRGGAVDSDPVGHVVWYENKTLTPPTRWEQRALRTGQPRADLQMDGAHFGASGGDMWFAHAGQPIHFKVLSIEKSLVPFTPRDALWDFGQGLPQVGLNSEQFFVSKGMYPINVVSWDAAGNAACAKATIRVESPSATTR